MAIFGKSYIPLIFSAILLILGVMILESLPKENLLGNPIYYLSAFFIVLGIFIPYWVHNILENHVNDLETRILELEIHTKLHHEIIEPQEKISCKNCRPSFWLSKTYGGIDGKQFIMGKE